VAAHPQSPPADVLQALSRYDSAIEELRQASRRPFFRFPIKALSDTNGGAWDDRKLPDLAPLKNCLSFLRLRAVAELEEGQSQRALEDVSLMLYLANLNRQDPSLESWRQAWRKDNVNLALQPIWEGLVNHKWSEPQLTRIEEELAKFDFLSEYEYYLRAWRAGAIQEIDFVEQTRFKGFWEQLDFPELFHDFFDEDTLWTFMPRGWFYRSDVAVAEWVQQSFRIDAEVKRRILSAHVTRRCEAAWENNQQFRSPWKRAALYISCINSILPRESLSFAFAQSSLDRALVACALEKYRLTQGEYPPTLDVLALHYNGKLPSDVINGQPLHYRRTDDGRFLLYSVGWNGTDDGGMIAINKGMSRSVLDKYEGDWVWPNPKEEDRERGFDRIPHSSSSPRKAGRGLRRGH
jgi:hypothetical protein